MWRPPSASNRLGRLLANTHGSSKSPTWDTSTRQAYRRQELGVRTTGYRVFRTCGCRSGPKRNRMGDHEGLDGSGSSRRRGFCSPPPLRYGGGIDQQNERQQI